VDTDADLWRLESSLKKWTKKMRTENKKPDFQPQKAQKLKISKRTHFLRGQKPENLTAESGFTKRTHLLR
jgi:hypothetical protein